MVQFSFEIIKMGKKNLNTVNE